MDKWQPIGTAPRDGTRILGTDGIDVYEMFWVQVTDDELEKGWVDGWFDVGTFPHSPTYWMPLPEPPE